MNRFTCGVPAAAGAALLVAATLFAVHANGADSVEADSTVGDSTGTDSVRTNSAGANPTNGWPIKFHPHLDLASTYDDNILISNSRRLADWYFTVSPGLQLVYGDVEHNSMSLDYTAGIERFLQHGSQDADNNFVTFLSAFNFTHLKLRVDHQFRDETTSNLDVGGRVHEQQNITDASGEYLLSKLFSFGLVYHQEFNHFLSSTNIDNNVFQPGAAVYYHAFSKTDLFTQFDYGWDNEQTGGNQVYQNVTAGVRGKITGKISGRVALGYQNRDYSGVSPSTEAMIANAALHGDFSRHTSADLVVLRQLVPSASVLNTSYTETRADISISEKMFQEKLLATAGGAYEYDDYNPNLDRVDNIWQGHVGLRYFFTKKLDAGVTYHYQTDHSSVDTFSFSQNTVTIDGHLLF